MSFSTILFIILVLFFLIKIISNVMHKYLAKIAIYDCSQCSNWDCPVHRCQKCKKNKE